MDRFRAFPAWVTMTMSAVKLLQLIAISSLCGLFTGCALGRSNVSMDSNSRAPWMNFELLPSRKKADPANYHRSIAEQRSDAKSEASIEPALATTKTELRLPGWLTPGADRTPLPLPRSDAEGMPSEVREASGHPDWYDF